MITSDYHMTRSNLIFRRILSNEYHDGYDTKNKSFCRRFKVVCHPSPNAYERNRKPRPFEERSTILNEWFLSELLEIEINGTRALNESLSKYNISGIGNNKIDATIKKIHEQYERETSIDHIS